MNDESTPEETVPDPEPAPDDSPFELPSLDVVTRDLRPENLEARDGD